MSARRRPAGPSTTTGRPSGVSKAAGFKANYFDVETGDEYWISGCKKDGTDRLYNEADPVEIDDDVREEYWTEIRQAPERKDQPIAIR